MKKNIPYYIIFILIIIICLQYCSKPIKQIDKPNITIIEEKITTYRDSIVYIDSVIVVYLPIRDSVRKRNKNTLDSFYNAQTETETMNRDDCDTIIQGLVAEIEIQDTLIEILTDKTILQDSVVHNLEIINHNFEDMLTDVEKELTIQKKKRRNNKIWMWVSTGIATILTVILIVD